MTRFLIVRLLAPVLCGALASATLADCDNPRPPEVLSRADGFTSDVAAMGWSMDADGQTVIMADPWGHRAGSTARGVVQIHRRNGGVWALEATIEAAVGWVRFGDCVAVRGELAAVVRDGAVHVYERTVSTGGAVGWPQTSVITIPRAHGVLIDGQAVYVVARSTTYEPLTVDGEVWEVIRDSVSGNWIPHRIVSGMALVLDTGTARFAVSGDTIVVSDPGNFTTHAPRAADVRVYTRESGQWIYKASLPGRVVPANTTDTFGNSVSIDGDTIAVGANWDPAPTRAGYARVFRRDTAGVWQLESEFEHPNITVAPPRTGFAMSVSVRGDLLAIGSPEDQFAGPGAGAVFVYQRDGGSWHPRGSFTMRDSAGSRVGGDRTRLLSDSIVTSSMGLDGVGGAVVFDTCSVTGQPGDNTPRCLPGILGLLTFLDAFFTGDPFADFNHSGYVSVQDIFEFLAAWFAGCP